MFQRSTICNSVDLDLDVTHVIVVSTNILPVCARVRDQHTKLLPVALCPTYLVVYLIFESAIEQGGGGEGGPFTRKPCYGRGCYCIAVVPLSFMMFRQSCVDRTSL